MKKLNRKFVKRNTASILATFHTMIDELEAVVVDTHAKSEAAAEKARAATAEQVEHLNEMSRASKAKDKIKAVFDV